MTLDIGGQPSEEVARLAVPNASDQQGFPNPIDAAIVAAVPAAADGTRRLDELPDDCERRRLSVLVSRPSGVEVITKGAFSGALDVRDTAQLAPGHADPLAAVRGQVLGAFAGLSEAGHAGAGHCPAVHAGRDAPCARR